MKNTTINLTMLPIKNIENILYNLNMSVRKIKKSYISCTGYFASYKNKTQIAFESTLERDFYMFLEFDEQVLRYEEQPLSLIYDYSDDQKRRYTPDTLVTYKVNSQKLFEVKYANEIENDIELQQKIKTLRAHIKNEYNLDFEIFTDQNFSKQYMENLKFIYKFVFIPVSDVKTKAIAKIIDMSCSISIREIIESLSDNQQKQLEYLPYVWNYIFNHIKIIDLQQKLTMKTTLDKRRLTNEQD
ncbi:MAG: TnsA endonuclease N-terminal domain-containing protein [Sulfurovaceae bacterium]|nr:TnsA endonuclease N-terminal domain-containing protein [Sulfurovaceae bacterium]